jgi:hypothetical protein
MIEADGAKRRTIASFERYQDADALVERLAQEGFPVDRLLVVGRDLELGEPGSGPPSAANVAIGGMIGGAALGALLGLLYGALYPGVPLLAELLYWLAGGVAGGLLAAGWMYWFGSGRKRVESVVGLTAGRYEVLADEAVADQVLWRLGRATPQTTPQTAPRAPPQTAPQAAPQAVPQGQ